jgi:DNA-binding MarR family transcriptional regulator
MHGIEERLGNAHSALSLTPPPPEQAVDALPQRMLDDLTHMLGRQLAIYTKVCQSHIAERAGLPLMDFKALEVILEFKALPTGQLAHIMGLSSGGTTALINRLEAAGYVKRGRHPLDRRIIVIKPVPARCAQIPFLSEQLIGEIVSMTARHNPSQMAAMHGFLRHCVHTLRNATLQWLDTDAEHNPEPSDPQKS